MAPPKGHPGHRGTPQQEAAGGDTHGRTTQGAGGVGGAGEGALSCAKTWSCLACVAGCECPALSVPRFTGPTVPYPHVQAANAEPARPFASLLHRALDAPPFDPYRRPPPRDHPFMPAAARPLDRYAPPAAPVPPSRRGVPDGRFVGDPAYARGPPPGMYAGGGGHVMPPSRGGAMPGAGMYGSGPPRQMR